MTAQVCWTDDFISVLIIFPSRLRQFRADSFIAGNATAGSLHGGADNDLVSATGNERGQIFNALVLTQSSPVLVWRCHVRLDNSGSSEESADSITIANISSGVVYGESGADTFNISGDARKASIYGGAQNDSVTIASSLSSGLLEAGEGDDIFKVADVVSSTVKGEQEMISSVQLVLSPQVSFMEMLVLTPLRSLVQSRARVSRRLW